MAVALMRKATQELEAIRKKARIGEQPPAQPVFPLSRLPKDLLTLIFGYFSPRERCRTLAVVCKLWLECVRESFKGVYCTLIASDVDYDAAMSHFIYVIPRSVAKRIIQRNNPPETTNRLLRSLHKEMYTGRCDTYLEDHLIYQDVFSEAWISPCVAHYSVICKTDDEDSGSGDETHSDKE